MKISTEKLKTEREYALAALALGMQALHTAVTLMERLAEQGVLPEKDIDIMAARAAVRDWAFVRTILDQDQWEEMRKVCSYVGTKNEEMERDLQKLVKETLGKKRGEGGEKI